MDVIYKKVIMETFKEYKKVVALKEMAAGNESVGNMWIESKTFDKDTPIDEVIEWASDCKGRLIITIDEATATKNLPF
jgi:CheY-specific phosphatase CheX